MSNIKHRVIVWEARVEPGAIHSSLFSSARLKGNEKHYLLEHSPKLLSFSVLFLVISSLGLYLSGVLSIENPTAMARESI